MKQKNKHGLTILISILIFFFTYSTIVCAGTYIYDQKEDKKIVHPIKKQIKKPNQVPAGTPYKHKKKGKNRAKPKKLK